MKPQLLVVELWGLGDLVIATPFLRAASEKYDVTVLAKPYAKDLQIRFWPEVRVVSFRAPWTAFKRKYRFYSWPWRDMFRLRKKIGQGRFDVGLSARPGDPRDHLLLALLRAKTRIGFPWLRSGIFLTHPLKRADALAHRYENWRILGRALDLDLPPREKISVSGRLGTEVLIHSGAGQPVRVWPLERYHRLAMHLRELQYRVRIVCDPDQREWWLRAGEIAVAAPQTVTELLQLVDRAAVFIGNDSGPGHLAAFAGVPTFTLFGPQVPDWFVPLHPASEWIEGKACPYKPCSDYCRWPAPRCLTEVTEAEVWDRVQRFLAKHVSQKVQV